MRVLLCASRFDVNVLNTTLALYLVLIVNTVSLFHNNTLTWSLTLT